LAFWKLALFGIINFILIDLFTVNRQSPCPQFQPREKRKNRIQNSGDRIQNIASIKIKTINKSENHSARGGKIAL